MTQYGGGADDAAAPAGEHSGVRPLWVAVKEIRSVGIVGVDYCGSTILNTMLDCLPGVFGAGETHWILDGGLGCRECGPVACPVLTKELLEALRRDHTGWWPKLAAAGGATLVVSSDKRPTHYRHLGCPDALIYLYKHPVANVVSRLKRLTSPSGDALAEATKWYVSHSLNRLRWVERSGVPAVTVALDALAVDPEATLGALCTFLDVEYAPAAMRFWESSHHYVGGNFSIRAGAMSGRFDVGLLSSPPWQDHLSPSDLQRVLDDEGIRQVIAMTGALSARA